MSNHVMLDLETFGTGNDAMIISIGAARFDPQQGFEIIDTFHAAIDPVTSPRKIDANTILWWLDPARADAWANWQKQEKLPHGVALDGFAMWLKSRTVDGMWGNGATFDNMLMRDAFQQLGYEVPWPFFRDYCFRTMKNVHKDVAPPLRGGTHHNALDDAVYQVQWLRKICEDKEIYFE